MKKILIFLLIFSSFSYATCVVSTSCESDLQQMKQDVGDKIDDEFDKLDDSINKTKDVYNEINNELDKEIHLLEIALKSEILVYKKLSEIDYITKQSTQIKSVDLSMIYSMSGLIKEKYEEK